MSSPVVSSRTPVGQIINRDGTATFAFLKWMQNIGSTINVTFDSEGSYQGDIGDQATIDGRATLASIVQNISTDGVVQGPGIDFALPYLNKDTDHIADGTGSPLAGGKVAYAALVASAPIAGQTIRFNGTAWLPVAIAISKTATASQWLRSYDAATGTFTASQPAFSDVSGVATKAQLPASIAYEDEANTFTANQAISGSLSIAGKLRLLDRSVGPNTGSPNINADATNIVINPASGGSLFLNLEQGSTVFFGASGGSVNATTGDANFTGTLTAGTKSFRIQHPLENDKYLIHGCLEGPEHGVFYRGRAKTDDLGYVTVLLPDYFEALTYLEDRSVLLTVINDGSDNFPALKSSEVSAGGFSVRSSIPETEFYWEIKAVRRIGAERLQVAQAKA